MPTSLLAFLITLRSLIRSRIDLQLENLALRHQIGVLQRSRKKRPKLTSMDRLLWVSLSRIWRDWRSTLAIVKPQTVVAWASRGLSLVLGLEGSAGTTRTATDCPRDSRPDPQDVSGESHVGCTAHSRRTAQARHRHRREQCHQVHAALPQAPSRPGEFHPEPLTDPDMSLSTHPARATQRRLPPSVKTRSSSGYPLTPS